MARGFWAGQHPGSRQSGAFGRKQPRIHCGCGEGQSCAEGVDLEERLYRTRVAWNSSGAHPGSLEGLDYAAAMSARERHLKKC